MLVYHIAIFVLIFGYINAESSEVEPSNPDLSCIGADLTFHSMSDCTKFYQCVDGYKNIFTCSENLYFNEKKQVCDYEESAGCGDIVDPEPEESEEPAEPDLHCTDDDLKFHSMPDCTKFYQCIEGHKFILTCPENLYFNEKEQVCDYQENAGCGDIVEPEPEESDEGNEEPSEPDPICEGADLSFHPMPDCTQFYQCVGGYKQIFTCTENLHFNPVEQVCDYPELAGCIGSSSEESGETNPEPEESEEEVPLEPHPDCIDADMSFKPMPDCTQFYRCLSGEKFIYDCPLNLHFNVATQQCDYPESAGCLTGA